MSTDDLKYRLGTGPGGPNIEDGVAWAAANDFHFLDFNADHGPNALGTWDDDRVRKVRQLCEEHDLHLGIHTLSAVNVAEFSDSTASGWCWWPTTAANSKSIYCLARAAWTSVASSIVSKAMATGGPICSRSATAMRVSGSSSVSTPRAG